MRRSTLVSLMTILLCTVVLPLGSTSHAGAITVVPASAIAGVQAIGLSAATSTAYVANAQGLFRSAMPPYTQWLLVNRAPTILALSPNPSDANDLMYVTADGTVYRSTDGGATATAITIIPQANSPVAQLARSASTPGTLYAGGSEYGSTAVIYRSGNDGLAWIKVFALNDSSGDLGMDNITSLTVDPRDANHVIAAGTVYHGGFAMESNDGGTTWHAIDTGPSLEHPDVVALNPLHPHDLWASWSVQGMGELHHSSDGGHTWTVVTGLPHNFYITAIQFDQITGRVYIAVRAAGQPDALYTTRDGQEWERYNARGTTITAPLQVISRGGYIIAGNARTPLTVLPLIGSGNWPVAAPFAHMSMVIRGLLGRPIAPSRLCAQGVCQYFDKGAVAYNGHSGYSVVSVVPNLEAAGAGRPVGASVSTATYATLAALHSQRTAPPSDLRHGTAAVAGGIFVPYSPHLAASPGYVVPAYFWRYMTTPRNAPDGWMRDVGLPDTRAVTATVMKGPLGKRIIVIQAFQSAILTYDPLNPPAYRVERANIGVDAAAVTPGLVR